MISIGQIVIGALLLLVVVMIVWLFVACERAPYIDDEWDEEEPWE
jgi:hypothetical protein